MDMSGYGTEDHSPGSIVRGQASITAQLNKTIATMHHIVEVFQWLSHVIVRTYDVQVTQWWEFEPALTTQSTLRLRGMICQDTSIPRHILVNDRVASMVEQLSYSPSGFLQASVDRLCTNYQATLLARYGLHYCSWRSLSSPAVLLPMPRTASEPGRAIPLNVTLVLLLREAVSEDVFAPINHILDQAISIATAYNLLTAVTPPVSPMQAPQSTPATPAVLQTPPQPTTGPLVQQTPPDATQFAKSALATPQSTRLDLLQLIPRPLEQTLGANVGGLLVIKPVIADKQAHRVYEAIDGKRTLEEIRVKLNMDLRNMFHAVQFLLMQRRIQLYEPNGQLVESSLFLKDT
jgi:hypothetical protein